MPIEFLDLVEAIRIEDAYKGQIWAKEGINVSRSQHRNDARYMHKLRETVNFLNAVYKGRIPAYKIKEAMSTSDFPLLFGDIIDRQALGYYREWTPTYRNYARVGTVPDFRQVKRFTMDGAESVLTQVHELEEYRAAKLSEAKYNYTVAKYGRVLPFSWEAILNDDLELLQETPQRFARAARRSEEKFATGLFVSSSGPNSTFFSNTNKNLVNTTNGAASNNPALSITGLQDAFTVLSKHVDADAEPIVIEAVELVVPPALRVIAENILNATQIIIGADSAAQRLEVANWMRNRVRLSVNPYLPIVDTTTGNTAWYLFASSGDGRPALEVGFLRGYAEPQLFMKSPNAVRVGAGTVNPMDGDFDNDSITYKIRHAFGGVLLDPKMAVASTGTGS